MSELSQMPITATPGSQVPPSEGLPGEVTPAAPEPANPFNLPPDVARVPVVQMVSLGQPPAVRIGPGEYYPELEVVVDNTDVLLQSGLDIYGAQDKSMIFFNPLVVTVEELQHLDQTGQLPDAVPDYAALTGSMPQEIPDGKVGELVDKGDQMATKLTSLGGSEQPAAPVEQSSGMPTPVPAPPPGVQRAAANNQVQNLQAMSGSPTSGPRPGGGRLLNALMRPTTPV